MTDYGTAINTGALEVYTLTYDQENSGIEINGLFNFQEFTIRISYTVPGEDSSYFWQWAGEIDKDAFKVLKSILAPMVQKQLLLICAI